MSSNKIIIYVGDCDETLAKKAGPDSRLLDYQNYREFLVSTPPGIYHTSHADLGKIKKDEAPLYNVLDVADKIKYCPPEKWSDENETFQWVNSKNLTEYFLALINNKKNNVSGLKYPSDICDKYLELLEERNTDDACLFVSGCSISYGVGVEKYQTFGHLISREINKELIMLAKPGTGLEFQKDQILRSDIRSGDTVIWGLTHELRRPLWTDAGVQTRDITTETFEETGIYLSVTSIFQVINFCRKIGAHLILMPIICSESLILGLVHMPEFLSLPYQTAFIDLGSDDLHPGSQQHRAWADYVIKSNLLK